MFDVDIFQRLIQVHPHTRGEIVVYGTAHSGKGGSPPHAWGDYNDCFVCRLHVRFTPTRVGRFSCGSGSSLPQSVHPHTRGEIAYDEAYTGMQTGSPPHAWGDSSLRQSGPPYGRFTPTRVGRFLSQAGATFGHAVHPHTRGEIRGSEGNFLATHGSPPHAWGDCVLGCAITMRRRFTPTRVGRFHRPHLSALCPAVHPHTRGEIHRLTRLPSCSRGSPPHAWGD